MFSNGKKFPTNRRFESPKPLFKKKKIVMSESVGDGANSHAMLMTPRPFHQNKP
jgi:hypothetical protein